MRTLRIAFCLITAVIAVTPAAFAETFVVTTDADSGAGSLREAITLANANNEADEIVFAADFTIAVDSPLPYVTSVISILGNGWERSLIVGRAGGDGNSEEIIRVAPTGELVLDSVMVQDKNSETDIRQVASEGVFVFKNTLAERQKVTYGGPGTVYFDDLTPTVSEDAGTAIISVTRWDGSDGAVSVSYSTSDGTAVAGVDYVATSGELSWVDREDNSKTFAVEIIDNSTSEGNRTVSLALTDPTGGVTVGTPTAILTITDNDAPPEPMELAYSVDHFFSTENGGTATVTVSRTGPSIGQVSVNYATEDLSAVADTDYTAASGTLTWADGDSADKTFTVPILNDSTAERTKLVYLTLSSPTGGANLGDLDTSVVVITDDDSPAACSTAGGNLCLLDNRFKIETEWRDQRTANHGLGTGVDFSNKTGFVWFFNEVNIELIVKMLDGRSVTGAYWLFYGALSDVEYWIVATDTSNGDIVVYRNVPGDICGRGDTTAFPEAAKVAKARTGSTVPMDESVFDLFDDDTFEIEAQAASKAAQGTCVSDALTLCLIDNRFEVTVDWENQRNGETGVGTVVPGTDNTGSFWFFNDENLELVVKVLNGVPVNGKFWVFYGALSDVIYTITVTDTETSAVKQYVNEAGNICGVGDTDAFDPQ